MTDVQQRAAAKQFVKDWTGGGYEKGDSQPFWLALLNRVYGIENSILVTLNKSIIEASLGKKIQFFSRSYRKSCLITT